MCFALACGGGAVGGEDDREGGVKARNDKNDYPKVEYQQNKALTTKNKPNHIYVDISIIISNVSLVGLISHFQLL